MTAEEQRVAAFLVALRESEERFPRTTSGGYVETLDSSGATIDGWWTVEQLTHALDAATPPAPTRRSRRAEMYWLYAPLALIGGGLGGVLWEVLA